ncbi:MAG: twin-arginine translocase subunit TatC, partial [Thermoanaerobaculia bacterium]
MSTLPEPGNPSTSEDDLQRMSLLEHLEEFRQRIFRSIIAVGVVFVFCWFFVQQIADFLARPIYKALPEGSRLTFLGVTDPFIIYVKVAALMALFLA